jgi:hypothetical protein
MNIGRGLFRIWIVMSVVWLLGVAVVFFNRVKSEFVAANTDLSAYGTLMLPVSCKDARGQEGRDYENRPSNNYRASQVCWYESPKFHALYPEYKDLPDEQIWRKLYQRAGVEISPTPSPWMALGKALLIGVAGPLALLATGLVMGWIYLGFRPA